MDQIPVVSERQFDGGERLIRALVEAGLEIVGACWAKTPSYAKGHLYLVMPEVEGADPRPTFSTIVAVVNELDAQKRWGHWLERIDPLDIMLVGPGTDMGKALDWEYRHYRGPGPTLQYGWLGASIPLEEGAAYIYPPESFRPQPVPAAG